MNHQTTTFSLIPDMFTTKEYKLLEQGPLSATAFRFDSGVCGLRLQNEVGELVMLPFQGQQIWSAQFGGRNLTMKSMFSGPNATQVYLENYGGFLLHCGFTAMGVPIAEDTHPVHGELPNAPYQKAHLVLGEDERGAYIGLGGEYQHTVAFSYNYMARPSVKLYASSNRFYVSFAATNLKKTPMEYMYMAHVNFRPVDNGRLVYSAPCTPEHVRVRTSIPPHVKPGPGYLEFLNELMEHPEKHHLLSPELSFDPELVFMIKYAADANGWAHTMQVHPDGNADYIAHRPDQLDTGVRWICRTPDQDAIGMNLPATAGPEGYITEKANGNVKTLEGGKTYVCEMEIGVLNQEGAAQMEREITQILSD